MRMNVGTRVRIKDETATGTISGVGHYVHPDEWPLLLFLVTLDEEYQHFSPFSGWLRIIAAHPDSLVEI